MNANSLIRDLKIASPCSARWEDMEGTDARRFCKTCQKNVYNFASLSAEEATSLLTQKEGRICGRFYQRSDGTLLMGDCPIGLHKRIRRIAYAAALLLFAATGSVALGRSQARPDNFQTTRTRFYAACDDLMWDVKGWFGVRRPPARILLGEIVMRPRTMPPPRANPGNPGTP